MWCALLGFVGGFIVGPIVAGGFRPALKKVVRGTLVAGPAVAETVRPALKKVVTAGLIVGGTVSGWAHSRGEYWHELVQEAKADLAADHTTTAPAADPAAL